jgi:hypothetical protein
MSLRHGILIGQTYSEKAADSIITILYLDHIGLHVQEHSQGFLEIPKSLVSAKGITAQAPSKRLDTQQRQQQQLNLLDSADCCSNSDSDSF